MIKQLEIGDEVYFGGCNDGRANHGAYCFVTKINRRSIKCTERKRSYRAGKDWKIGAGVEIAWVNYNGTTIHGKPGAMQTVWGELEDNGLIG